MPESALTAFCDALPASGTFSLWYGPVDGEPWFVRDPEVQHYAASTMKLALVMAAFAAHARGDLDLDALVEVRNGFRSAADGSPFVMNEDYDNDPLPWQRIGGSVSLRWLAYRAVVRSSNLATNLLLDAVGADAVERLLRDAGATDSTVRRGIEDNAARAAGLDNVVTAADLAAELQALHGRSVLDDDASDELLHVLAAQQVNDAIPAGLPAGTPVAHKSGWVEGVTHDAALVGLGTSAPFILVVCTTAELDEDAANRLIAQAAGAAWIDHGGRR